MKDTPFIHLWPNLWDGSTLITIHQNFVEEVPTIFGKNLRLAISHKILTFGCHASSFFQLSMQQLLVLQLPIYLFVHPSVWSRAMSLATTTTTPGEVPSQRVIVVSWQPDRTFRTISELRNPPIDVSELNNISSLANFKALKLRETFGQVYGGRNKKNYKYFFLLLHVSLFFPSRITEN